MIRTPSPLKKVLLTGQLWWRFYQVYKPRIRDVVVDNVCRVLACGSSELGGAHFECSNPACDHKHFIPFTCKSRFCPTCGKKRTDQWIAQQQAILPQTQWQHITLTMPGELWPLFALNRLLLGQVCRLAAHVLINMASKKGFTPGIFTALHTFGRDLKWNVHVHLSVTRGGLNQNNTKWKNGYFDKYSVMSMWRYAVIMMLRDAHNKQMIDLPEELQDIKAWAQFLNTHYNKPWIIHLAKPSNKPWQTIRYLGRYIARPPLAMSRLQQYDGHTVIFRYLNHYDKKQHTFRCSAFEFIGRLVRHIPDKGFRMIRYYGFLANRVRGQQLPIVRKLLGQQSSPQNASSIRYADMLKAAFNIDPSRCILCQSVMEFVGITLGIPLKTIAQYHKNLALSRPMAWPL